MILYQLHAIPTQPNEFANVDLMSLILIIFSFCYGQFSPIVSSQSGAAARVPLCLENARLDVEHQVRKVILFAVEVHFSAQAMLL